VRRRTLHHVGEFDGSLVRGTDDVDWFARAHYLGVRWCALDDVVLRRWVHDANASADSRAHEELLAVVRRSARRAIGDRRDDRSWSVPLPGTRQ
jgi:hypothetical protein